MASKSSIPDPCATPGRASSPPGDGGTNEHGSQSAIKTKFLLYFCHVFSFNFHLLPLLLLVEVDRRLRLLLLGLRQQTVVSLHGGGVGAAGTGLDVLLSEREIIVFLGYFPPNILTLNFKKLLPIPYSSTTTQTKKGIKSNSNNFHRSIGVFWLRYIKYFNYLVSFLLSLSSLLPLV